MTLSFDANYSRLQRRITKHFAGYLTDHPVPEAACINISAYKRGKIFPWSDTGIEPFADCISKTLARLPHSHPVGERTTKALHILRHISPRSAELKQLNGRNRRSLIFAMSGASLFFYRPDRRTATAILPKTLRADPMVAAVINAIMFVLSHLLATSGGLLLHGSAVEREGATVLFIGRSGSGKSTAARLCRPDTCFADDGVTIVRSGRDFWAQRSPFRQIDMADQATNGSRGAIGKVFLLDKQVRERISDLARPEMMRYILQHAIHFYKYLDDDAARKGFESVKLLLDTLPVYRLEFTHTSDVWRLISQTDGDGRIYDNTER
jgi:hypothetical protein